MRVLACSIYGAISCEPKREFDQIMYGRIFMKDYARRISESSHHHTYHQHTNHTSTCDDTNCSCLIFMVYSWILIISLLIEMTRLAVVIILPQFPKALLIIVYRLVLRIGHTLCFLRKTKFADYLLNPMKYPFSKHGVSKPNRVL